MKTVPKGYYAILYREKGSKTIGVRFPAHSGVISFGHDWEEAEENAREALAAALEAEFERGIELPLEGSQPKGGKGERVVFVPLEPEIRVAYLLRSWREAAGMSQKEVAERLGISYQAYQRMERPGRSNVTVGTLWRVAEALDGELVLDLKPARKESA